MQWSPRGRRRTSPRPSGRSTASSYRATTSSRYSSCRSNGLPIGAGSSTPLPIPFMDIRSPLGGPTRLRRESMILSGAGSLSQPPRARPLSGGLGPGMGEPCELGHDQGHTLQPCLGILPFAEEDHLLVGPDLGETPLLGDPGDEAGGIVEDVVAEG